MNRIQVDCMWDGKETGRKKEEALKLWLYLRVFLNNFTYFLKFKAQIV